MSEVLVPPVIPQIEIVLPAKREPLFASRRLLLVALVMVFLGSAGAWYFKTDGGAIEVTGIKLPTENGQWITADLFRPRTATEKTPAPAVVVCPGFERSKETLDSYSIELARRGFVVITIDPYNQGASSSTMQRRSATVEGYGTIPMVEYIASTPNLNYIDKTRIGATGYSAGGNAVLQAAAHFGGREPKRSKKKAAAAEKGSDAEPPKPRAPSKLAAVFAGGYVLTLTDEVLAPIRSNVGMDYARWDEGSFRNAKKNADMRTAPEALRLVNSGLPKETPVSEVVIGRPYGNAQERTLRVVHNTVNIHPLLPYDPRSIGNMVQFFTDVLGVQTSLAPLNQRWYFKEALTLVALVGAFLFLLPFTKLLLQLPFFGQVAVPEPPPLPRPGGKGLVIFWTIFAVTALVACFSFVPLVNATFVLFPKASAAQQTWWFPQRINNAILLWAVFNGSLGLLLFWLNNRLHLRKKGDTSETGLRISGRDFAKTLALSLAVFAGFYLLLSVVYGLFHTDFRFLFVSATVSFPAKMLLVFLEYVPFFFIFYLANSIRVNAASRFEGQREWLGMLIMGLGNSVGLMLILAIQYGWFIATGTVCWTAEWLFANLLFGVIPMMFVLPYFNRYFFRLTGRVYVGALVTCFVFILMMLTNNVCYIPLG